MNFEIQFENEHVIALVKPAGVLTTPAREQTDPRPCLGRELQRHLAQQIFPVHRLDFEVSGLVLFARTRAAHTIAQRWFEKTEIGKTYQGFSRLGPNADFADGAWHEWRSRLVRGKRRSFEAAHGQEALTRARYDGRLWWLEPITGRPHQLRVEMAKRGMPLAGDALYGAAAEPNHIGIALRAIELSFKRIPESLRLGLPELLSISPLDWR